MRKGTKSAAIFGGIALMAVLVGCGDVDESDSARVDTPETLTGTWYQTNTLDNGVMMQAQVYRNGTIQVDMRSGDGSHSHYWMGSFPSSKNPKANFKTTSRADSDAQKILAGSIFGSQDTSKRFAYKNGDLSFKFTMLGTTSTIHLRQPYENDEHKTAKVTKTPPAKVKPNVTKKPSTNSTVSKKK